MARAIDGPSAWFIGLVACALIATACGSTQPGGSATDGSDVVIEAGGDVTQADDPVETAVDEGETTEGPVMFGDLVVPCGPGDAAGATDQGVTATEIRIATGDDRGFADTPGLNHEQGDAIEAFVDYCNGLGGINGRRIVLDLKDAAMIDAAVVMQEACEDDFMLVGHGFSLDGRAEPIRVACGLPAVPAWTADTAAAHGPWMLAPIPGPVDRLNVHAAAWLAETRPEVRSPSAVVYDIDAEEQKERVLAAHPELGYDIALSFGYTSASADWETIVTSLDRLEPGSVYFGGSCLPDYQQFRRNSRSSIEAPVIVTSDFYDPSCVAANGDRAMNDTYMTLAFIPFEEAEHSPATAAYLRIVHDHGGDVSLGGAKAASAFLLWATAASACGSDLTRACVLGEIRAVTEWTAGGLHAPTAPGTNNPPDCGLVVAIVGTTFVRVSPEEPGTLECGSAYRVEVETDATRAARLDEQRISGLYPHD